MLDPLIIEKLRERNSTLHPLLFHRSVEHAKSNGDLFDILETIPKEYPLVWSDETHSWKKADDLYLADDFFKNLK